MAESRRSRTRTLPPNDAASKPAGGQVDQDADTEVVAGVTHFHGGERDFHPRGHDPHYTGDDGRPVWGTWTPPGVKLWEYVGIADVNEHRHDDRHQHSHTDYGQQEHVHNPANNAILPLPSVDGQYEYKAPEFQAQTQGTYTAAAEASRVHHPSGHDPTPQNPYQAGFQAGEDAVRQDLADGNATDPAAIEQAKQAARAASDHLAAVPTPQPPATPVPEGVSRSGTSIAHPGAFTLLNSIHGIADDALNHEMAWLNILAPLVIEAATYHADQRREGGDGPQLAPMELWMRARDAMEHIVQPRLAREAQP